MGDYLIFEWVKPKSGFDLHDQNKSIIQVKNFIDSIMPENEKIPLDIKGSNGLILKPFEVSLEDDNREMTLKRIREKFPEIRIHSFYKMENNDG